MSARFPSLTGFQSTPANIRHDFSSVTGPSGHLTAEDAFLAEATPLSQMAPSLGQHISIG